MSEASERCERILQAYSKTSKISVTKNLSFKACIEGAIVFMNCVLQSFKQHMLETDPVRVKQIIERALEDASWVVKKASS
jgi:hypothetical protein